MLLLAAYVFALASSAPVLQNTKNPPANTTRIVGWTEGPDKRGTLDILLSCVLTLCLCVWSALHLNVPAPNEKRRQGYLRWVVFGLLGVFAPEFVVCTAWDQWCSARALRNEINKLWEKSEEKGPGFDKRYPWTNVHGFHGGMGGYAFGINPQPDESLSNARPNNTDPAPPCTLTAHGVLLLAQCGQLPDISKEWILDKSKADGIAKLLVCLQALWMLLQVIGRVASGITVTLLEVSAIGHVFCALVMYLLWWDKPRDVGQPLIIEGEWVAPLHAFMSICSKRSRYDKAEAEDLVYFPPPPCEGPKPSTAEELPGAARSSRTADRSVTPEEAQSPPIGVFIPLIQSSLHRSSHHRLAALAIQQFPLALGGFLLPAAQSPVFEETTSDWVDSHGAEGLALDTSKQLVMTRAPNIDENDLLIFGSTDGDWRFLGLAFMSTIYGGIHIAGWAHHFPSNVEKQMWRFSAIFASSGILGLVAISIFTELVGQRRLSYVLGPAIDPLKILVRRLFHFLVVLYALARMYLVVEAFISLRALPEDAYDTVEWLQLIPHL